MASPNPFDKLSSFGTAISAVVPPTFQLYIPLLLANESAIRATKRTTHSYGAHERQELDVYYPSKPHTRNGRRPVLVFLYGGGLVNGAKQVPGPAQGIAYTNLGHFFAEKFGFTVVIVDYRLMSHGAKFPSGGEDLSLAVEWICENTPGPGEEPIDLFVMGNSAGGIHTSQFLFCDEFASTRAKISSGSGTRLRGVIMLAVPFHFEQADPSRIDAVLNPFFGDYHARCPLGLLKSIQASPNKVPDFIKGNGVRVLVLDAELDPEDEILVPRDDFMKQWLEFKDSEVRLALCADRIAKHNHISPPMGLGTGIHEQEQWGFQVAAFVHSGIAFPPSSSG